MVYSPLVSLDTKNCLRKIRSNGLTAGAGDNPARAYARAGYTFRMSHTPTHSLAAAPATHAAAKNSVVALRAEELRAQIIAELSLEHLSEEEQNQIIESLGEVLLERATYEVLERIPEEKMDELDALGEHGSDTLLQEKIREYVPNIEEVVAQAVKDGIAEHKRLVAEQMEQGTADNG